MSSTARSLALIAAIFAIFLIQFQISPKASAADFEWSFSEDNDTENRGQLTARLGYSVPETDNAQVDGGCDARGGLKLYSFRYLWDDTAYVGVMAQDLIQDPVRAEAVHVHTSGYYMVDYASLGLEMVALKDWRRRAEQ